MLDLKNHQLRVAFAVSFYLVTSITMVLVNKAVLNEIDFPITFLFLQVIIAVVLMHAFDIAGILKVPKLEWNLAKQLGPLIAVNVIGLTLNTYCLKNVDASFYQIARSLILPFTLFLTWFVLGKSSSRPVLMSCVMITVGFFVGSSEVLSAISNVTVLGLFFGISSSMTTAYHAIVIKKATEAVPGTMDLVYYNNVLTALALPPVVLLTQEHLAVSKFLTAVSASDDESNALLWNFIWGTIITGFFGFLINLAGFLQIQITSPVTHMVSSAARGVLQALLAVVFFEEYLGTPRILGTLFVLGGGSAYGYFKALEGQAASLPKPAVSK